MDDLLQRYGSLVDCIADLLGATTEVVLHDVRAPDHSIIHIRNGHVTGRSAGAPLTDLGFYMLRESEHRIETLGIYQSTTDDGKTLKCNAVNLRDSHGKIEAILCINMDVTGEAKSVSDRSRPAMFTEHYQNSVEQVIRTMIAEASRGVTRELTREEKSEIVRALEAHGVFLARGAVKQVAVSLQIAMPTVYKYIQIAQRNRTASARVEIHPRKIGTRPPKQHGVTQSSRPGKRIARKRGGL